MLEEFKHPILLTPTIYSMLKEDAILNRRSTRVHLDIILRERLAKEPPAIENNPPTVSSLLEEEEDVKSLTFAPPKTTIGIGYIASTLIKTQAKLNVQSVLVTLNEVVKKVYPEAYKLLEDRLVGDDSIEIRKLQLESRAELLTMKNKITRSSCQKVGIGLGDFIKDRINQRELFIEKRNSL
jgi:hypothetical protein